MAVAATRFVWQAVLLYYRLLSDAFSMSATNPRNQRYMRLFAYLPLAFHPAAKDVLLLCYGCGVTADAFTRKSTVERIDVVDISKEVFALADFYSGINYSNPLREPKRNRMRHDSRLHDWILEIAHRDAPRLGRERGTE